MIDRRGLRRLATALRSGGRGLHERPGLFAVSVGTMASGLLLLGAYLLVVENMRAVLERAGRDFRVVAFVEGRDPAPAALAELQALPGVRRVQYVSPQQALARLRADLGEDAAVLDGLERNPLPGSLEIELHAGAGPAGVRALAERVRALPGVEDVRYGEDWVEGYARVLAAVEGIGLALGGVVALLLVAVVGGTVRLAVHARSDEVQIQRLVGAGAFFVRLPFYVEGALQGALAALLALAALRGLFALGLPLVQEPLAFVLGGAAPAFIGPLSAALLLGLGPGLGAAGAVASLLRVEEAP